MKPTSSPATFVFASILFLVAGFPVNAKQQSIAVSKEEQIDIEHFDVPEMVVALGAGSLVKMKRAYLLKCSASNLSEERITGLQLILLVFDPEGKLTQESSWMEKVDLSGFSSGVFSFEVKLRKPIKQGDRVVVAVQQAIAEGSIWSTIRVEDLIQSYILGGQYPLPEVKRVKNQLDTPLRLQVIH